MLLSNTTRGHLQVSVTFSFSSSAFNFTCSTFRCIVFVGINNVWSLKYPSSLQHKGLRRRFSGTEAVWMHKTVLQLRENPVEHWGIDAHVKKLGAPFVVATAWASWAPYLERCCESVCVRVTSQEDRGWWINEGWRCLLQCRSTVCNNPWPGTAHSPVLRITQVGLTLGRTANMEVWVSSKGKHQLWRCVAVVFMKNKHDMKEWFPIWGPGLH